ncbi:hopanoid-associated phosphorylase [Roseomonas sp. CCTCC AB2023176]|uniref:phosphorylase family protein n=1 Tax=Roseomonas sp. CCTCC AB2023176 TaxID=3342640 RepID=UPI0035DBD63E
MIVAAVGLQREARLLATAGVTFVIGGGHSTGLRRKLGAVAGQATGLISIGIAGALAHDLRSGDWIVADSVIGGTRRTATDPAWTRRLADALSARTGTSYAGDRPLTEAATKTAMHAETGAIAADMESHVVADIAREYGRPFAVARVVADRADQDLPPAALVGMRPDGSMNLPAVLRSLLARPAQLPALIATGIAAERAFRALSRLPRDLLAIPPEP